MTGNIDKAYESRRLWKRENLKNLYLKKIKNKFILNPIELEM